MPLDQIPPHLHRHPPRFTYKGLTVVVSNPSRFDTANLLSGMAGQFFNDECLAPTLNRWQCDLKLKELYGGRKEDLLPGTKCVLLLGEDAYKHCIPGATRSINAQRGSPIIHNGIPHIVTYLPQDSFDMVDHESRLNEFIQKDPEHTIRENEDEEPEAEKDYGRTKRSNFRFWLQKDIKKAVRLAIDCQGILPKHLVETKFHIYPHSDDVIRLLSTTKNKSFYLDIETDAHFNMLCFGFSFGTSDIYTVPLLRYDYSWAYTVLPQIVRALAIALRDNEVVSHNGSTFDWFVLAFKYRLAVGRRLYDTLLAQQRIYPEIEKSLGHCVSLWLYEPFHKDVGSGLPYTSAAERDFWMYNARDVATMALIHKEQLAYAAKRPGLLQSIQQVNSAIRSYLTMSMIGMPYNLPKLKALLKENDRQMTQYLRMMSILMGPGVEPLISNQKCVTYFHHLLGYDVIAKSKKTGNPSLDEKAILKLRLKYPENAVLDILLRYRTLKKESGSLGFIPQWSKLGELPTEQHENINTL